MRNLTLEIVYKEKLKHKNKDVLGLYASLYKNKAIIYLNKSYLYNNPYEHFKTLIHELTHFVLDLCLQKLVTKEEQEMLCRKMEKYGFRIVNNLLREKSEKRKLKNKK